MASKLAAVVPKAEPDHQHGGLTVGTPALRLTVNQDVPPQEGTDVKIRLIAALAGVSAAAAIAPAAQAATITYEGNTLVYSDDNGEVNDVIASEGDTDGYVKFYEYAGAKITGPQDKCQAAGDGLECVTPQAMRVVLGGGSDEYSLGFGFPATMPVELSAGDGDDVIHDDYAVDKGRSFDGGAGNDTIEAYKGPDTLIGGPGDDTLKGGAGADTVRGGDGNDQLEGDKYSAAAADVIDGGAGFDIMEEYSIPDQDINPPASVTQDGVANDGRPGENDNVTGVEKITSHVAGVYKGTEGNDEIWVWSNITSGDSTIHGLGGDDKLTGEEDSETIDGGAGNDTIQGGYGNDTIVGGPGKDKINSDGGSYCGGYSCEVPFGDDTVDARDGEADQVECGIGNDTVKADAIDQVSPSCETVQLPGTAPGPTPGPDPDPQPDPGTDKGLDVALIGAAKLSSLRKSGTRFRVTCAGACKVAGTLSKGTKKVGAGSSTLIAPGTATVRVKPTAAGKKALKKVKTAKLTLKVTVQDATGAVQTVSRTVTFK
jgi:Ca2+-binding RTX toxin-like protein